MFQKWEFELNGAKLKTWPKCHVKSTKRMVIFNWGCVLPEFTFTLLLNMKGHSLQYVLWPMLHPFRLCHYSDLLTKKAMHGHYNYLKVIPWPTTSISKLLAVRYKLTGIMSKRFFSHQSTLSWILVNLFRIQFGI